MDSYSAEDKEERKPQNKVTTTSRKDSLFCLYLSVYLQHKKDSNIRIILYFMISNLFLSSLELQEIGIKHEIKIILKPIYNVTLANHKTRRKFDLKKKETFIWNYLIRAERFKGSNWLGKLKRNSIHSIWEVKLSSLWNFH